MQRPTTVAVKCIDWLGHKFMGKGNMKNNEAEIKLRLEALKAILHITPSATSSMGNLLIDTSTIYEYLLTGRTAEKETIDED